VAPVKGWRHAANVRSLLEDRVVHRNSLQLLKGRAQGGRVSEVVDGALKGQQVGGQVAFILAQDGVGVPEEHAAVPEVATRVQIGGGRGQVGLFLEALHLKV